MAHCGIRRFNGYDYSRGGSMFISTVLEPRIPLFGTVDHNMVKLSPAGQIAQNELLAAARHFENFIALHRFIIMPDHAHARFSWQPGHDNAKQLIAKFVQKWKQTTAYKIYQTMPPPVSSIWQHGYHDIICASEQANRTIDNYIDNNPLKYWLMHCDQSLMHIQEPILLPELPQDNLWRAIGYLPLLDTKKLVSLRVSQKIPRELLPQIAQLFLRGAVEKGYTYISTFFSPGECQVRQALVKFPGLPIIQLLPTFLKLAYRPHGDEAQLFSRQRLLLLSRAIDPAAEPSRDELVNLNYIAAQLATSHGGKSIYATWHDGKVLFTAHPLPAHPVKE